jgi:hypothetical protein
MVTRRPPDDDAETPASGGAGEAASERPAPQSQAVTAATSLLQQRRAILRRRVRRLSERILNILVEQFETGPVDWATENQRRGARLWYNLGRKLAALLRRPFPSWLRPSGPASGAEQALLPFQQVTIYERARQVEGATSQMSLPAATGTASISIDETTTGSGSGSGLGSGSEAGASYSRSFTAESGTSRALPSWLPAGDESFPEFVVVIHREVQTETTTLGIASPENTGFPIEGQAKTDQKLVAERQRPPEWLAAIHRAQTSTMATQTEERGSFTTVWSGSPAGRNWESVQVQLPVSGAYSHGLYTAAQRQQDLLALPNWGYVSYRVEQDIILSPQRTALGSA